MKLFFVRLAIPLALTALVAAAPIPVLDAKGGIVSSKAQLPAVNQKFADAGSRLHRRAVTLEELLAAERNQQRLPDPIRAPKKVRFTLPGEELNGGVPTESSPGADRALASQRDGNTPAYLRSSISSKSRFATGLDQPARTFSAQGRSWLSGFRFPTWRGSASPRVASSVMPSLSRQNAVAREAASAFNPSWWQRISEGAKGLIGKARSIRPI